MKNKKSYILLFEEKKTSIRPNKFASGKPALTVNSADQKFSIIDLKFNH